MKKIIFTSLIFISTTAISMFAEITHAQSSAKQLTYALVRCETAGARESFCEIDTRKGVRLKNDLSGGRCTLGRSWGYDERGIWVANGCAGDFEIGYPSSTGLGGSVYGQQGYGQNQGWGQQGQGGGQIVSCRSQSYEPQLCSVDTRGGVRLLNQVSRSACVEGQSWFAEPNGIRVTSGCGGEFEIGYSNNQSYGNNSGYGQPSTQYGNSPTQIIRCESQDKRQKACPADLRDFEVRLSRQLSKTACIEGQTWGWDERGIWVNGGCRADFSVTQLPPPPINSNGNIVRCESRDGQQQVCNANTRYGVRLSRQLSRTACVEGQNWGTDRNGIWVSSGCRAEFELLQRGNSNYGGGTHSGSDYTNSANVILCESINAQQQYCAANTRNGVRLVRQISRTACVQGQSWGSDSRGIWVSGGCRAEFEVNARKY